MMRKRILVPVIFLLLLTLLTSIVVYFSNNSHSQNILRSLGYTTSLDSGWYVLDDGEQKKINVRRLGYYADRDSGELSIYYKLPASTSLQSNTLALRSAHIAFEIYLNDEPYYSYGTYSSAAGVSQAPGSIWHFIEIPPQAAGNALRMDTKSFYLDGSETITNTYYGKSAVILRDIIIKNMIPFGLCILLAIIGIAFMVLHFISNSVLKISTHILYIGMFIFLTAIWSLMHTSIPMFFIKDASMLNLLDHMLLMLAPIALQLHIDRTYKIKHKKIFASSYAALIINFIVQIILWHLDIYDFHVMQDKTHLVILYASAVMFATIYEAHKQHVEEEDDAKFYDSFLTFSYGVFFAAVVIDIARIYISTVTDSSFAIRIALVMLTMAAAAKSLLEVSAFARENYVSTMVRSLAYKDTLTNLGNRTSFTDTLSEIELSRRDYSSLAVFVFDVNYLKYVNDTFGHQQGDTLIISCAECIDKIFASDCQLFRIGGDEFAAIYAGNLSSDILRARIATFYDTVSLYNTENPRPFKLQVAVGVAFMNSSRNETMDDLFKRADRIMYDTKRSMKEADNA